jgi:hypothetical protein
MNANDTPRMRRLRSNVSLPGTARTGRPPDERGKRDQARTDAGDGARLLDGIAHDPSWDPRRPWQWRHQAGVRERLRGISRTASPPCEQQQHDRHCRCRRSCSSLVAPHVKPLGSRSSRAVFQATCHGSPGVGFHITPVQKHDGAPMGVEQKRFAHSRLPMSSECVVAW